MPEECDYDNLKLKTPTESESSVIGHLNKQLASQGTKREVNAQALSEDQRETLQYICNVFLKYLETLYSLNTGKKQDQV